ncbi:MAG: DUF58 domain-containing protein [Oscillospiraceae bacterium]
MTFASIVTLVQVVFFAAVFLLFISGSVGWTLIYAFVLATALSIVLTVISRKHYTVEMDEFSGMYNVGDECVFNITLQKTGFCIMPYITIEGSFCGESFTVKTSLVFRKRANIELRLKAHSCCLQRAVIDRIYSEDFLWILRLKRKLTVQSEAALLPRVVEYTGPDVVPTMMPSDDERESGASVISGGRPGYEHREYVDGDSPRRINYKLSAKKRRYMVRLDESTGTESTNIILAPDADAACAEQSFALAAKLVMSGFPAAVFHGKDRFEASSPETLGRLREWLAFRDLGSASETVKPDGTVCVIVSPAGISINQ